MLRVEIVMITSGTEFGLKLMRVVGAQVGVTYLSAPISTGYRDLRLMRELGVSKDELRERFAQEYRERVTRPNEREAHKFAQMVRQLDGRRVVINPGELTVAGWRQSDYMAFWEETIRSYCLEIALAPGWEYSAGARYEATLGLATNLRIIDVQGRELSAHDLQAMDQRARLSLAGEGFAEEVVEGYVPRIDFTGVSADPADLGANIRAFSDIAVRHHEEIRRRQSGDRDEAADS